MVEWWSLRKRDYSAGPARRIEFRALLEERYCSADLAVHEMVFGELAANAVRHGEEPISVGFALSDEGFVQIRVENAGGSFDLDRMLARFPAPSATGGRGLQIVRALVDTLTVELAPLNTCRVTATLRI
jgi:anti-sigma regulatory factor (Ser/Thr protein kinase)